MNYEKIGEFIAKKRKEKNLTQKDLAQLIGVTDKAVSKWERGLGCPDVSILEILSKELDVSILEILKGRLIENEVIQVTELNDYVLDTVKYSSTSIKDRIKKTISNIITFIIIFICAILLILNIIQIIDLNKGVTNTLTTDNITEIKKNIDEIEKKINIIKSNQGKYSDEDYANIVTNINSISKQLHEQQILKYNENSKISKNDFYLLDNSFGNLSILNTYLTLAKYESTMNDYFNLYIHSSVSRIFSNSDVLYLYYRYQLPANELDVYELDNDMRSKVESTLYMEQEILYLMNNIIEVGDINE